MLLISPTIFAQPVVLPPGRANVLPYVYDEGWTEVAIADEIADGSGMGDEGFGDGGGSQTDTEQELPGCEQSGTGDRINTASLMITAEYELALAASNPITLALFFIANPPGGTYTATLGSGRTSNFRIAGVMLSAPLSAELSCE